MSVVLSWGRWGGFYVHSGAITWRVCLGWVALTVCKFEIDDLFALAVADKHAAAWDEVAG